jgi:hypothetical protein
MFGLFGPRMTTVFRSKWRAVWFVLSVLLGVWLTVPKAGDKDDPDAQKDVEAVAALVQQQQPAEPAKHVNPWAKNAQ